MTQRHWPKVQQMLMLMGAKLALKLVPRAFSMSSAFVDLRNWHDGLKQQLYPTLSLEDPQCEVNGQNPATVWITGAEILEHSSCAT
jgi:hypothetical protein